MLSGTALEKKLAEIHARMKTGDVAGALRDIERLAVAHGNTQSVRHLQALVRRASGDLDGAKRSFEAAMAAGDITAELLNSFANLLTDCGDLTRAEMMFLRAIEIDPTYVSAKINLGRLFVRLCLYDEAIIVLKQAAQIDAQSSLALVSLGNAYRAAGMPELAVETMQKAAAIAPQNPMTHLNLGIAHNANADPNAAILTYNAIEKAGFVNAELLDNRAAALLQNGDTDAAMAEYDRLVRDFPAYFSGHNARARLAIEYALDGDPFASYRTLAQQHPGEHSIWQNWLAVLVSYREHEEVLRVAAQAERAAERSPMFDYAKAVAYSETGQIDDARAMFDASAAAFSSNAEFQNARVRHAIRAGQFPDALRFADLAVQLSPRSQSAWAYRGLCWRLLNDEREYWLHDYDNFVDQSAVMDADGNAFDLDALAAVLRGLHTAQRHPPNQSLRGGTQTEGALLARKEAILQDLGAGLQRALRHFVSGLRDDDAHPLLSRKSTELRFAGSWSVRLHGEGFHIRHVHDEGWISSAMHIVLPKIDGQEQTNAACLELGAPPVELGLNLEPRRVIVPRAGALVLFPSSMWHGTVPFAAHSERLTVAFDAVPKR